MSGLCGWMEPDDRARVRGETIMRMAEPLGRLDGSTPGCLIGDRAAIAAATLGGSVSLFHADGMLAAVCGNARFADRDLSAAAAAAGVARTFAESYRDRGPDALAQLDGAFAVAVLDETRRCALLATDRMGIHPLVFTVADGCLVFGSNADAINRHSLVTGEIDRQAIYDYVYFHMVPAPRTVYARQQRLLPGTYLAFRDGAVTVANYWSMRFDEHDKRPFGELQQDFLRGLRSAVRIAADGKKAGAFLSGGTDSSTVAGLLGEATGGPARTYSIGFDAKGYDEMEYARIAARHFRTEHHEYYVTPDDVVRAIPGIAAVFDQPFGNSSAVPSYYCARLAKSDGIDLLLGGDGGDELFGGNVRYAKQYVYSLYGRIPARLRSRLIEPLALGLPGSERIPLLRRARSYIEKATVPMPARLSLYNPLERFGYAQVFTPDFLAGIDPGEPVAMLNEAYHGAHAQSLINRMLALDIRFTLADNDLPKVSRACELARVEAAYPMLDRPVVEFSAKLEPRMKLKGTTLRYFFKQALRGFLPEEILRKRKHGFGLPFAVWLRSHQPLRDLAYGSLAGLKKRGIVRPEFIDRQTTGYVAEHADYHGTLVWVLMMLEQWFQEHADDSKA